MPMGIDDNYNGVPNDMEAEGQDPKDKLRELLMQVLEALGPAEDEPEGNAPMPLPDGAPLDESAPEAGMEAPADMAPPDPKAKLLAMLKAKSSQGGMPVGR